MLPAMTFDIRDIHSLSDFQRNAKNYIQHLQESHKPLILTVNGKAALIVQDAESYQELLNELEVARSAAILKERMDTFAKDGIDLDARAGLESLRDALDLPR